MHGKHHHTEASPFLARIARRMHQIGRQKNKYTYFIHSQLPQIRRGLRIRTRRSVAICERGRGRVHADYGVEECSGFLADVLSRLGEVGGCRLRLVSSAIVSIVVVTIVFTSIFRVFFIIFTATVFIYDASRATGPISFFPTTPSFIRKFKNAIFIPVTNIFRPPPT